MLKATPHEELGERFIYIEASKEAVDQQNEIVMAKALEDSCGHFLKYGSLDLDHKSMPSVAARHGITVPQEWEIGYPIEARFSGGQTFVKARLFSGDTQLATKANMVWESMTKLKPAARWYPSVGGVQIATETRIDEFTKSRVNVITKVRWSNLALAREPVNQHVGTAGATPFGMFAKSLGGFVVAKGQEAGYESDVSKLDGGSALRMQSLDGGTGQDPYFRYKDALAKHVRDVGPMNTNSVKLVDHCVKNFGLPVDESAELVERFLRDLKNGLNKRSKT